MRASLSRVVTLTALAALVAVGAGCQREPKAGTEPQAKTETLPVLSPVWQAGRAYVYSARLKSSAVMDEGQASSPLDLVLESDVELVPLRVTGSDVELAFRLPEPKFKGQGQGSREATQLTNELARPLAFTLKAGKVVEARFAPGLSPLAVSMLRTLMAGFQFASQPQGSKKWTASEYDSTGEYEAEYEVAGAGSAKKRKLAFKHALVSGKIDAENRRQILPKVVASSGELTVEGDTLAKVRLVDTIEAQLLQAKQVKVTNELALELRAGSAAPGPAPDRAALLAQTEPVPANRAYGPARVKSPFDDVRVDGRSFEEILKELELQTKNKEFQELWAQRNDAAISDEERIAKEEAVKTRIGVFSALVALLRQQPDALPKAVRAIRKSSPAAKLLLDGLKSAGTVESQKALGGVVREQSLPLKLRADAATSLVLVRDPSPDTIQVLQELVSEPKLADFGIYGLGIAARHLREGGNVEKSRELSEQLVALLKQADQPRRQISCLRGIANSAYEGALDALPPYLTSENVSVRAAAVEAVRLIKTERADAIIAERLTTDRDLRVRMAALRATELRQPSATLETALSSAALSDVDIAPRQQATQLLARWLPTRPSLRPTLERVAQHDVRPQIRQIAQAAIDKK